MNFKEIFSDDEVNEILLAPFRIFYLVAEADNKIDKKEFSAFEKFLKNAKKFDYELVNFCFNDIQSVQQLEGLKERSIISDHDSLKYISGFLSRKIDREIGVQFKTTLVALAYYIAFSSGSFFSHNVSDDETEVIQRICKDLDVSYRELMSSNQIQKFLNKIEE